VGYQPGLPEAYFRRGRVLELAGKTGEAIAALLEGWQLLAKDDAGLQSAPAAWLLARCWDTLGHPSKAVTWREETISRAGKLKNFFPAEGYYWEGKALYDSSDSRGAARALEKAISCQLFHPLRREAESILKHCRALEKKQNREKQIQ
jgi:tetratricopeptide (TPR) repeat protein